MKVVLVKLDSFLIFAERIEIGDQGGNICVVAVLGITLFTGIHLGSRRSTEALTKLLTARVSEPPHVLKTLWPHLTQDLWEHFSNIFSFTMSSNSKKHLSSVMLELSDC